MTEINEFELFALLTVCLAIIGYGQLHIVKKFDTNVGYCTLYDRKTATYWYIIGNLFACSTLQAKPYKINRLPLPFNPKQQTNNDIVKIVLSDDIVSYNIGKGEHEIFREE